jgi:Protein of unknown function (DUF2924)/Sodium/calcium exchanger protein
VTIIRQEVATVVGYLTLLGVLLFGGMLSPDAVGVSGALLLLVGLFLVMLWVAFTVVRHAESLATLLGEPFGTLILTLSVIGIEVALIASVMLAGADKATLARDTMFSVVMIVLNGLVGLSLLIGGLRHRLQDYNLIGASAYLAVLIPLAVLALILPRVSSSAPGGELSQLHATFLIGMSVILYGVFLAILSGNGSACDYPTLLGEVPGKQGMPRRSAQKIRAGARLVREWNGRTHTVTVEEEGFTYAGGNYRSLSAIARDITGARWSGPRFFGLAPKRGASDA